MAQETPVPQRLYWIASLGITTFESLSADESKGWMYWYRTLIKPEVAVLQCVAARDDADELVAVGKPVLALHVLGELDRAELPGL